MSDLSPQSFDERLAQLWQQSGHEMARSFLKRALRVDSTLAEVIAALSFEQVQPHLGSLRLREVVALAALAPARHAEAPRQVTAAAPAHKRRRRRSPEEMQVIQEALMARLQAAVGSVTAPHLQSVLGNAGHSIDLLQINRMLNALKDQGYLTCLGGKPKLWRFRPQGRAAPELPRTPAFVAP